MKKLEDAHRDGGWLLLQNIHLTMDWTSGPLEKFVDKLFEGAHKDFRYVSMKPRVRIDTFLTDTLIQLHEGIWTSRTMCSIPSMRKHNFNCPHD